MGCKQFQHEELENQIVYESTQENMYIDSPKQYKINVREFNTNFSPMTKEVYHFQNRQKSLETSNRTIKILLEYLGDQNIKKKKVQDINVEQNEKLKQ